MILFSFILKFFCFIALMYYSQLNFHFREKKLLVGSHDFGKDLTGVQNLRRKHQRLVTELKAHETRILAVVETGKKFMAENDPNEKEIEVRSKNLMEKWEELNKSADERYEKIC